MKLVRVGEAGHEIPAVVDENGHARDVSMLVQDIDGISLADGSVKSYGFNMAMHLTSSCTPIRWCTTES